MQLFGFEITRTKASTVDGNRGWHPLIREPYAGAWQRNREISPDTVLAHHAVYACVTLIASDVGKLRPKLVELDRNGIWTETTSPAFSPVLRKPNRYQNRIQFIEWWITSKLVRGNTYVLKERDNRGVVKALYLLDPSRVKVSVAPDGSVFYKLEQDNLSGIREEDGIFVPASEIIHDRMNCLFHPLVGVSPIFASGTAAMVGLNIESNAESFFGSGSNPSGILTAPTPITKEQADDLSERWNKGYSGENSGKVAVLGSDLKFEPVRMSAVDAQMIEHLKWTAETVCSAFHVPAFKIGAGEQVTYQNGETYNQIYYSDCLQSHIEQFELAMDDGLGIGEGTPVGGKTYGVELDLDALLRMDTAAQYKSLGEGIGSGLLAPNEGRRKIDLKPVAGGDTPYLQQQNYSLAALDERDRSSPLVQPEPEPTPPDPTPDEEMDGEGDARAIRLRRRNLRLRMAA